MELYNDAQTTFLYTCDTADVYVTKSQYKFNGMEWGEQTVFIQGFPGFHPDTRTAPEIPAASTQANPPEIQQTTMLFHTQPPTNVQTQFSSKHLIQTAQTRKSTFDTPQKTENMFCAPSVKITPTQSSNPTFIQEHDVLEHSHNAFLPGPSACYIENTPLRKTPSFETDCNDPSKLSTTPRLSSVPITVKTPTIKNSFCTHTNVLSNNRKKVSSNTHDIWIRMLYSWLLELNNQMDFSTCLKKFLGAYLHPSATHGPKQEYGELLSFSEVDDKSPLQNLEWTRAERRKVSEFKQLHSKMDKEEWNYISKNFMKYGKINYTKVPVLKEFASILQDSLKRTVIQKTPSWEAANPCPYDGPKLTQAELDKFNSSFMTSSSSLASSHTPSITASLSESASASSASDSAASSKASTPSIPTANLQASSSHNIITVAPVLVHLQPIHPLFKTPANVYSSSPCITPKTNFEQLKLQSEHTTPTATITESSSLESELHKSLCMEDFAPRLPPEEVIRLYTCIYLENYQELWNSDVVILQNTLVADITDFMERHPVIEKDILEVVFQSIDLYVGIYTDLESLPQFT